ncbi:LysR family transcriptional regulator [Ferrovibrio sp.]|uniref:LysR family transcriptional regulator n=1 Tax=Ferrovibrio sp. TaxID=1917215 RepID=UPI00311F7406
MIDNLADLAVFAKVVELNSFSEAARNLKLSKSAVSKQVARLEDRLGAQLLQRTTRRLTLTETGRIVLTHAQRVLAEADAADIAVQSLYSAPRGRLRVNLPLSFGLGHIAPLVPDFLSLCPELHVDLSFNDRLIDLLEEDVDLAIRIGDLRDSTLVARRLAPARAVFCAAPAYLRRAGVPLKPGDLRQHECLLYTYLPEPDSWPVLDEAGIAASIRVSGRLHANNGDALRAAALAGHGIVRLPSFIVGPDLAAGLLVPVLEDFTPPPAGIYAVYPAQRYLTPKVRAFIDFLAERFGPEPPWDCVWLDTVGRNLR